MPRSLDCIPYHAIARHGVTGEAVVVMAIESRGASNAKAKREMGWTLRYPSSPRGFVAAYSQPASDQPQPVQVTA